MEYQLYKQHQLENDKNLAWISKTTVNPCLTEMGTIVKN